MASSSLYDGDSAVRSDATTSAVDGSDFAGTCVFDVTLGEESFVPSETPDGENKTSSSLRDDNDAGTYGAIGPITCAFLNETTEQEFLADNLPRLIKALRIASTSLFVIHSLVMILDVAQFEMLVWPPRYSSYAAYFVNKVFIFVSCFMVQTSLVHTIAEKEWLVCIWVLLIMQSAKTRFSYLFGEDPGDAWNETIREQPNIDLAIVMIVTYFYMALPIPFRRSWPVALFAIPVYLAGSIAAQADTIQGNEEDHGEGVTMVRSFLIAVHVLLNLYNRRSLELLQRSQFLREKGAREKLIDERVMRYEAENALFQSRPSWYATAQNSAASEIGTEATTTMGAMIKSIDAQREESCADVKATLHDICELGASEHWLLNIKDISLCPDRILGKGGFGMVLVGQMWGTYVAVKVPHARTSSKQYLSIFRELRIYRRLRHPNIVFFYGAVIDVDGGDMALVLEYVQGAVLEELIQKRPEFPCRHQILCEICCGLRYLHEQNILHGDLKPSNVIIELPSLESIGTAVSIQRAKLTDFGLSPILKRGAQILGGSLRWMAPELIAGNKRRKAIASSDVYSFGRMIYFVAVGKSPVKHLADSEIIKLAKAGSPFALDWPAEESHTLLQYQSVCSTCTAMDPAQRPSSVDVHEQLLELGLPCSTLAKAAPLIHNALEESSAEAIGFVFRDALLRLNVPLTKPCCHFHSGVESLRRALRELSCRACIADPSFHPTSQCPQCGILCLDDSDVLPMRCDVCQFQGTPMM